MRYLTSHNFIGRRIPGYRENVCLLTRPAAEALKRVQAAVRAQGYTLKVYDCYRPQRSVDAFVKWAKDLADRRMKAEFYPRVRKQVLFKEGYIASQSGHSRGSTMDLTLVKLPARRQEHYRRGDRLRDCARPARRRFRDNSIDMGTGYDCFDPLAHPYNGRIRGKRAAQPAEAARADDRRRLQGARDRVVALHAAATSPTPRRSSTSRWSRLAAVAAPLPNVNGGLREECV